MQGALETMGIPYSGSGVMASALAMDKWRTKLVWLASGIPTPRFRVVDAATDWMRVVAELGLPLIVKPAREGSTIGITKVAGADRDELALAYAAAARHDDLVLVEEFVTGVELTASILGERALPLIRIEAPQGNYDYHNKYFSDETKYFCPCGLDEREGAGNPGSRPRGVPRRGLQRLGPARPDPEAGRLVPVSGGEHVAGDDRPLAGADGGEAGGARASASCAWKFCGARMWDDAKQLNAIAAALALCAALGLAWGALAWALRQPPFEFREVIVRGPLERASAAHVEAAIRGELTGTFFTMNLDRARSSLAAVPWVRNVALRRQWPQRLEVTIEEHAPLARWNDAGLVNTRGRDVRRRLQRRAAAVRRAGRERGASGGAIPRMGRGARTARRSRWRASGSRRAEAGGSPPGGRAERWRSSWDATSPRRGSRSFVAAYERTIGALTRAGTRIEHVDLRYRNGFAARVPGFRERAPKKAA